MRQAGFTVRLDARAGHPIGIVFSQEPGGLATKDTSAAVTLHVGGATPKPGIKPGMSVPTQPDLDLPPAGTSTAPIRPGADLPPAGTSTQQPTPTPTQATQPTPTGPGAAFSYQGHAVPEGRLPTGEGPEVPSVLGQSAQQARTTLQGWRIKVEQTLAVESLVGKVVNQWPQAGSRLPRGATLTMVVAVTKRPSLEHRYVPQAENKAWRDAIGRVERAGLLAQPVSVPSTAAQRGTVIAQTPQPGSLISAGQTVRLFVGRGPGAYNADAAAAQPTPVRPTPTRAQPSKPTPDVDLPPAGAGATPIEPGADLPTRPTPIQPAPTPPTDTPPTDTPPAVNPPASSPSMLPAPSLRTPPAGESYPYKYGADFTWTPIQGAASYDLELQELLPSGTAWQTQSTTSVTAAQHRPARISRGRYRWRVRPVAADGAKGNWSAYRRLYMY